PEITRLLDADHGIHLDKLLAALCSDFTTAEHALANLLTTATISTGEPALIGSRGRPHMRQTLNCGRHGRPGA
ncbi:MAG: hypothetical protein ACRDXB_08465, partial [Actinomycetes bacterium]